METQSFQTLEDLQDQIMTRSKELRLNTSELAAYAAVSRKLVSEIFNHKRSCRLDKLLQVSHSLGIQVFPFSTMADSGAVFRQTRRSLGLRQTVAASLCGVSTPFLSDLENNKKTLHAGKVFSVIQNLGISELAYVENRHL